MLENKNIKCVFLFPPTIDNTKTNPNVWVASDLFWRARVRPHLESSCGRHRASLRPVVEGRREREGVCAIGFGARRSCGSCVFLLIGTDTCSKHCLASSGMLDV
jgi:hypothetical protein